MRQMLTKLILLLTILTPIKAAWTVPIGKWVEIFWGAPCNPDQHEYVFGSLGKGNRYIVAHANDHGYPFGTAICDYDSKWKCYVEWWGERKPRSCKVLIQENQTNKAIGETLPEYQWISVYDYVNSPDKYTAISQSWTDALSPETYSPFTLVQAGERDGYVGRFHHKETVAKYSWGNAEAVTDIVKLFSGKILVTNAIGKRVLSITGVDTSGIIFSKSPSEAHSEIVRNTASSPFDLTYTHRYENEEGSKVSIGVGIKAGITVESSSSTNVGIASAGHRFAFNLETSFTYDEENWKTEKTTEEFTRKMLVPAMAVYNITLTTFRTEADIPFSAEELIYDKNNKTVIYRINRGGTFRSVSTNSVHFKVAEVNGTSSG